MTVLEPHAVGGSAFGSHDLGDLRDLVVLADNPAVLHQLVAFGCVHLNGLLVLYGSNGSWPQVYGRRRRLARPAHGGQPRARWVRAMQTSTAAAVRGAAGVSRSPRSSTDHTSVSSGCASCNCDRDTGRDHYTRIPNDQRTYIRTGRADPGARHVRPSSTDRRADRDPAGEQALGPYW